MRFKVMLNWIFLNALEVAVFEVKFAPKVDRTIVAQMSKRDSDSEHIYCWDDSEFNFIPGPYVI